MKWTKEKALDWYEKEDWLVGFNFLPSTSINQLEMFQEETFDPVTIKKELGWAKDLGFNSARIYLHDLLWIEKDIFCKRLNEVLDICSSLSIKPILVLFDDCHRPYPKLGKQPLPVKGVHNSGWKQSPGMELVHSIHDKNISEDEIERLKDFVQGVIKEFNEDQRILMWDIYNEPGQFGVGDKSLELLTMTWDWAQEVRPSQPLTSCLDGSVGKEIIKLNKEKSDVITFHTYEAKDLEPTITRLKEIGRPLICTEYMAREHGTTFQFSMPIFKKHDVGCYNWGLVAGKSQTHFGWPTILDLHKRKKNGEFIREGEDIPEPKIWFHDIFRTDGSAYDQDEVKFIKSFLNTSR
ncbi:MAG: 1,4-beta-xylanase [Gammaproteobacteria bacterium]